MAENEKVLEECKKNFDIQVKEKLEEITKGIDFSELCITSKAAISFNENKEINVKTLKAKGDKCPVCWKISEEVCFRHSG